MVTFFLRSVYNKFAKSKLNLMNIFDMIFV